ncbi:MAG: Flp pilus assembly complex ATPase component TadA, partial [Opitutaceae bacterium]|nr:Flp pilus assembly complex ATPase component TadA [Opitutaceae bacterium]
MPAPHDLQASRLMPAPDDFTIQLALEKGALSEAQVAAARARIDAQTDLTKARPRLVDQLVADGATDWTTLCRLLAAEFNMPLVDIAALRTLSNEAMSLIPPALAHRHCVFPIARHGNTLRVAIADPLDVDVIDNLHHVVRLNVEPCLAPEPDIRAAITRYYGRDVSEIAPADSPDVASVETTLSGHENASEEDAPIIKLVHQIIIEAIQRRASDIHLEPLEKRFRVRYRIDGVLMEVENPPKRLQLAIISRLKIMANISIAEKRIPQDGRIQINLANRSLDLRVSSLPTAHGESIVMRILDKEGLQLGLPELGFLTDDQKQMERLISLPDGIMLVTGPTGSGKTTTLYSCLHFINKPDRKIITVEDPVEYQLGGINQVPVRHEVGMTFASALRAMLRQAPNIVMVGEIRDLETAEIAINASLTGHMVFSTLHTNDAPGAVTRLIDIGVKPFLVSTSLRAVLAQRLVRKICKQCKKPHSPDSKELRSLNINPSQAANASFAKGDGCPHCNGTGYRGRMGIFEIFTVNEEIQRMIYDHAGASVLREKARALGMRTMR